MTDQESINPPTSAEPGHTGIEADLAGMRARLQIAADAIPSEPGRGAAMLSAIGEQMDEALEEFRNITKGTRPGRYGSSKGVRDRAIATPSAENLVRVVIADDSVLIREGLAAMLDSHAAVELLAACSDGEELERVVAHERPDVVITDIRMPPSGAGEGILVAARLRESFPKLGVVVISEQVEPEHAVELMRRGSSRRAYLLKDRIRDSAELMRAVRAVKAGGSAIDPVVVEALIAGRRKGRRSLVQDLTPRELQILAHIAEGKSNTAVAEALFLTKRAVEKHVNAIFGKLALSDPEQVSPRVKATLMFLAADQNGRPHPEAG